jgi:type II secretory pathway predicted ATPase ExeA
MYEGFFKLHGRPFLAAPQTSRYFPATVVENAHKTLTRTIERGEGAGLIVGPPGTGKTLLCQLLSEEFADRFDVALLASGRLATRQALLQAILYELGLPYRGLDEGELRLTLVDHLEPKADGNQGLLLIIDEAHSLPWRLLEEVRLLTNLVRGGQSRVRVILAGSPLLEERFASPKMNSFSQRLAARCYVESLDGSETADYVRAQVIAVGGDPAQLFHEEALRSIHRASDGIPRLINQICDHALILASLGGVRRLTREAIEEAWADLQQLPTPWNSGSANASGASHVVEFGGLDDTPDEMPEAIPFRTADARQLHLTAAEDQLDAIEDQLAQIDSDFQPAGSIGTEVDLDFAEFGDPLNEQFAEEEVVLDRYSTDVEIFADLPRVSSLEGQQLGSILDSVSARPPQSRESRGPAKVSPPLPNRPSMSPAAFIPATDPVLPEEPIAAPRSTVDRVLPTVAAVASTDDRDVIVIEDDISVTLPRQHAAPLVRKLEYRQLFAKLRRG